MSHFPETKGGASTEPVLRRELLGARVRGTHLLILAWDGSKKMTPVALVPPCSRFSGQQEEHIASQVVSVCNM